MADSLAMAGLVAGDATLFTVAERLLSQLRPALLLITLGEHVLLCQRGQASVHIDACREVFDVSGAGDTVVRRSPWRSRRLDRRGGRILEPRRGCGRGQAGHGRGCPGCLSFATED
jgi:hypothetical protein